MSDIVRPSVPSLPTLPLTSDAPATFSARADAVVAALNSVGTGASGLAPYLEHVGQRAALTSTTWPAFCARATTAQVWDAPDVTMTFPDEEFDNTGAFNGQLFTAPSSGVYLFSLIVIHDTPVNGALQVGIYRAPLDYLVRSEEYAWRDGSSANVNFLACESIVYLTAGQQVGARILSFGATGMVVAGKVGSFASIFCGALLP